jgi:hypothetical protein
LDSYNSLSLALWIGLARGAGHATLQSVSTENSPEKSGNPCIKKKNDRNETLAAAVMLPPFQVNSQQVNHLGTKQFREW